MFPSLTCLYFKLISISSISSIFIREEFLSTRLKEGPTSSETAKEVETVKESTGFEAELEKSLYDVPEHLRVRRALGALQ